jgi:hypothetical protein
MTDKVQFSFAISNLVDRLSGPTPSEMTGKTKGKVSTRAEKPGKSAEDLRATPAATAAAVGAAAAGAAATSAAGGSAAAGKPTSSRQIMETFLQGAATPTKRIREDLDEESAAKRAPPEDEEPPTEEDLQWQQEMRDNIEKEVGLSEEQVSKVMNIVLRAFKLKVVKEARKIAMQTVAEDYDSRKSYNSIIIHRADQWVANGAGSPNRPWPPAFDLTLAEKVTVAIHHMTGGSVAVLDAYTLGRWDATPTAPAVLVTFGSRSQKSTFFKLLARKGETDPRLRVISCRDAFPKRLVRDSQALAEKGANLRRSGGIAAFRVVARGMGCIPVLEVKGWEAEGRREARWRVYNGEEPLPQRDGRARTPRTLVRAGSVPGTPSRPTGIHGIHRLSVPMPGTEGDGETVRLDLSDDQICTDQDY